MREIKFRAWDGRDKMYYPTVFEFGVCGVNGLPSIAVPLSGGGYCTTAYIMQYTGLRDKQGKEIYEGDIVRLPYYKKYVDCMVCWGLDGWWTKNVVSGYWHHMSLHQDVSKSEVIGNIYENAELLEAK
jgi:hypothetical protein